VGPTLYAGLHRNGAIDGYIHLDALQRDVVFFVGNNLKRNPFTRPLAIGIGLARAKDSDDTSGNRVALAAAKQWLADGGALFIYPEGTSTLGPSPLRFHRGAAVLAIDALAAGIPLRVVPVGIDYENPATPGSEVDVMIGDPVDLAGFQQDPRKAVIELHKRIETALTRLAFVFPNEQAQARARHAALVGGGGNGERRLQFLRRYSDGGEPLSTTPRAAGVVSWGSVPSMLAVFPGVLVNAPLVAAAWYGARLLADGPNVVALYRILIGLLGGVVWIVFSAMLGTVLWGLNGLALPLFQVVLGTLALRYGHRALLPFIVHRSINQ
jgi:1-acyl-sn-glycerol-3-phosphate acyltransferase